MIASFYRFYKKILGKAYVYPKVVVLGFVFLLFFISNYLFFFSPPTHFPVGRLVTIESGLSVSEIARELLENKVIRSRLMFKILTAVTAEGQVIAGDYFFSKPRTVFSVTSKLSRGEYGLEPSKVLVFEGATSFEIGGLLARTLPEFDSVEFMEQASLKEGYLFPDTYYFLPNVGVAGVISAMEQNFYKKISGFEDDIAAFGKPLKDIIIMASLLEKEAHDVKTRQMISGILWKRLEIDMPLQVDAVFLYINGKNTYELSMEDLRNNNSPYNTYKYKGLPPGPIGNPSLDSIFAAVNPIESDYLFYLSDRVGNTYYARTFDEHKANKNLYIY